MSMMQMLLGATGATGYPSYLQRTDNLEFYIDFHNSDCYEDGDGTNITDLTGNYSPIIVGTEDTNWSYGTNDTVGDTAAIKSDKPYIEINSGGYIKCNPDGGGDIIEYGTGAFTLEVWIKPDNKDRTADPDDNFNGLFIANSYSSTSASGSDPYLQMKIYGSAGSVTDSPGHCVIGWRGDGSIQQIIGDDNASSANNDWYHYNSSYITDSWGGWNHYVITREGSNYNEWKIYLNNQLVGEENSPSSGNGPNYGDTSRIIELCKNNYSDSRIGMFRVYNGVALSAAEVDEHWEGEKASYNRS